MARPFLKRVSDVARKPLVTRLGIGLLALLLLFGLFGYFVLPGIVKSQAEKLIAEKLHRPTSIGKVEVSPYTLVVTVRDLKLMEPKGKAVFASFEALTVDFSAQSLWRLAPVAREVRLTKPYLHLARTGAHAYNIDDILALMNSQPPSPEPARFSVYNIQVEGGHIVFDDKPNKSSHTVTDLKLGVPFISSLHSQVEVFVEPLLSAKVDGAPFLLKGRALPFAEPKEAVVELNLDGLDLTTYLDYLPFRSGFKVPSARFDLHMTASFQQPKDKAPALMLNGSAALKSVRLSEPDGKPVLKLPELVVSLDRTNVFTSPVEVARLALTGLEADVTRDNQGRFTLLRWLLARPVDSPPAQAGSQAVGASAARSASPIIKLGELVVRGAALHYTDERASSPMRVGVEKFDAALRQVSVDLGKKRVNIGELTSGSANFLLQHDKPTAAANDASSASDADKPAPEKAEASPYVVSVGRLGLEHWSAHLEDRSLPRPAVTVLAPISLSVQDFSTAPSARGRLDLKAAVNKNGSLAVGGAFGLAPLHADLALDLKEVDILPLQPYVTDKINVLFTRVSLSSKGSLQLDQGSDGVLKGGFKGNATLGDLATIDKLNGNDFLRWKSLFFGGVNARLQPFALTVDQIALADFFARVIIDPSGRINLQDIARSPSGGQKSLTEAAKDAAPPATKATPAVATAAAPAGKVPPIKIRKLTLQGGKVRFTDNFIKPNYTANLMDLGGVVEGLSSDAASSARVDLRGQVNGAPLSVAGRINPLKGDLAMDIQAKVRDMELAPLSPYSDRYVGYGIEKGKLSFDVAYRIENRKLTAQNRLILDQLTFGEKIDNPDATKLPVHLAVALLRDRNGVIDINLPIAGSFDDPQFSVGGIIIKVIVNLVTKAVTAPFALLGSLFGGGEELSYLEFEPGRAAIPSAGEAKLQSLAKALVDRPALKLEITGRTGAEAEREGLKRALVDRKLRSFKAKELVARGESVPAGGVVIKPEEYPALLARVYKEEKFPKPRNLVGLQKELPVAEMEKLMIANMQVEDGDLIALGNQRAQTVKDWLLKNGQVPGERVFIIATKPASTEGKDDKSKASPSRVDFSLR